MARLTPRAKEVLVAAAIGAGFGAALYLSQRPAPAPTTAAPYLQRSRHSGGGAEEEAGTPVTLPPAWETAPYPH